MALLPQLLNPQNGFRFRDNSPEDLTRFAQAHPYFAGSYWLLLNQQQQQAGLQAETVSTAALYFSNLPGLQSRLTPLPETMQVIEKKDEADANADDKSIHTYVGQSHRSESEDIQVEATLAAPKVLSDASYYPGSPDDGDLDLTYYPYHTVDYFASQGIKLSAKIDKQDHFGKQVRSFTDWLKTMRKLPEAERAAELDEAGNQRIIDMAEDSVLVREVITASMAEVLAHQGKIQAAISIYEKLSLHNPAKSPFFAAKIDALKQQL
jgi:hypothetical protein